MCLYESIDTWSDSTGSMVSSNEQLEELHLSMDKDIQSMKERVHKACKTIPDIPIQLVMCSDPGITRKCN